MWIHTLAMYNWSLNAHNTVLIFGNEYIYIVLLGVCTTFKGPSGSGSLAWLPCAFIVATTTSVDFAKKVYLSLSFSHVRLPLWGFSTSIFLVKYSMRYVTSEWVLLWGSLSELKAILTVIFFLKHGIVQITFLFLSAREAKLGGQWQTIFGLENICC